MHNLKKRHLALCLLLVSGAVACSDEDVTEPPVPINEAEVLINYVEANRGYDVQSGFVIKAKDVHTNVVLGANQHVIDIRAAADFATGHIPGAVNVAWGDLATYMSGMSPGADSYDVVVIACYSGQSAAYATGILRAMGYENVKSMKWGMSSWHEDFSGSWVNNRSNVRATQFVTGPSPAMNAAGEYPVLNTGFTDGSQILDARVSDVLAAGFGAAKISNGDLFNNLSGHYIINYWPPDLYQSVGHIPGAIDYDPSTKPFLSTTYLKTLPTDMPLVIYCYTGQTSSYISGYLRVLGYDAKTLLFGANGMIFDSMVENGVANAFDPGHDVMNYEYEM